mgnify:CR=1 FL=1
MPADKEEELVHPPKVRRAQGGRRLGDGRHQGLVGGAAARQPVATGFLSLRHHGSLPAPFWSWQEKMAAPVQW